MAFFGLFGGDKPTSQNIQNLVVKVRERYAQPEYRRDAMERLLAFNTEEALLAVAQRFCVVVQSPHWDEEEKRWLVDELVARGDLARSALENFLLRENEIRFAARALQRLAPPADYIENLMTALNARPPEDHRTAPAKVELVQALGDTGEEKVIAALLPYLDDHSDDVQCAALDVLEQLLTRHGKTRSEEAGRLARIIHDDTRSARVLRHAARVTAGLAVPLNPELPIAPTVTEDYAVRDRLLVRAT